MRIHARTRNALWFGPARGRQPIHRFDDPAGRFRVCYFGTTLEVCFAETFLRNPPVRILALDDLAACSIATVEVVRDLRLVPIHGPGPARLGVTAELASGNDYAMSQLWSRGSTVTSRTVFCIDRATTIQPSALACTIVQRMVWQSFSITPLPRIVSRWRDS